LNKFFISFAAIASSGVMAYSFWREMIGYMWLDETLKLLQSDHPDVPYFHSSEELYLKVLFIFGLIFSLILIGAVTFTIKQKWGWVFFFFVLSMMTILALMINGAIK
jgi:hypothetical protein